MIKNYRKLVIMLLAAAVMVFGIVSLAASETGSVSKTIGGVSDASVDYGIGDSIPFQLKTTVPAITDGGTYKTQNIEETVLICKCGARFITNNEFQSHRVASQNEWVANGGNPLRCPCAGAYSSLKQTTGKRVWTADGSYRPYRIVFVDTLPDGMDFDLYGTVYGNTYDKHNINVKINGIYMDSGDFTASISGRKIEITVNDIKAAPYYAGSGAEIIAEYSAKLNSNAVFRNENAAYMKCTHTASVTSDTDRASVFAFTLSFGNADENGNAAEGFGYTLYKKASDGTYSSVGNEAGGGTEFNFNALGTGSYKLVQSTTPYGYKKMDDLEFSITAACGLSSVTSLKITDTAGSPLQGWTASTGSGTIRSVIVNRPDASKTRTISATVDYVLDGETQISDRTVLTGTAQVLSAGEINTGAVSAKTYTGYKLDSVTVNGGAVTKIPDAVSDKTVICFNYVMDEGQTKHLSARVEYKLGNEIQTGDTVFLEQDVQVLQDDRLSTAGIITRDYYGWKLKNITVDGREAACLPPAVDSGSEIVYNYMIDREQTKTIRATIFYNAAGEIRDTVELTKEIQVLSDGVLETGSLHKKQYEGYELDRITVNGEPADSIPSVLNNNDTVICYYIPAEAVITVRYVDEDGNDIADPDTMTRRYGDSYTTSPREIEGYASTVRPANGSGITGAGDITVIYRYSPIRTTVTARYVNEDGEEIAEPEQITGTYGGRYETVQKEIEGYGFVSAAGSTAGTFGSSDAGVVYLYNRKDVSITVRCIDENGKTVHSRTVSGKYGTRCRITADEITGYSLVSESGCADIIMEDGKIVEFAYEAADVFLVTRYVDEDGREIAETETVRYKYGQEFTSMALHIDGYILKSEGQVSGIFGTDDIEAVYTYERAGVVLVIAYVDENGDRIMPPDEIPMKYGDSYETAPRNIEGYVPESPQGKSGTITESVVTVTHAYRLKDITVTVKHTDENGNSLVNDETISGKYGEYYTTGAETITGYKVKTGPQDASGYMPSENMTLTYVYEIDENQTRTLSASVEYNVNGETVAEDVVMLTGKAHILDINNGVSTEGITERSYYGHELTKITVNDETVKSVPKTVRDGDVITYYYTPVSISITVQYVDEDNAAIEKTDIITKQFGDPYTTEAKEITGYRLISVPDNAEGTAGAGDITVSYVYEPAVSRVTVKYTDTEGNEIAGPAVMSGRYGEHYAADIKKIDGYALESVSGSAGGTFGTEDAEVVCIYKRIVTFLAVRYIDETGNNIIPDESLAAGYGDTYRTYAKDLEGYRLVSDSGNTDGVIYGDAVTVTYVYTLKDASVTVKYVDEYGNGIALPEKIEGKYFDPYETFPKEIDGYTLAGIPYNAVGEMAGDTAEVVYTYSTDTAEEPSGAMVVIKYVDESGSEIFPPDIITGRTGDRYATEARDIDGYSLTGVPLNADGTMDGIETTVVYVYETVRIPSGSKVTIKYVDDRGAEIADPVTITGRTGDFYTTPAKYIDGYGFVSSTCNTMGIMSDEETVVVYTYRMAATGKDPDDNPHQDNDGRDTVTISGLPSGLLSLQVYSYNPFPVEYNGRNYRTGALIAILSVNPDGTASISGLPAGTYRYREYKTCSGFSGNRNYYTVEVPGSGGARPGDGTVEMNGSIKLTGTGSVSLKGMEFKLANAGQSPVVYNNASVSAGETVGIFRADRTTLTIDGLPYGTYELLQVKSTDGYHADPSVYTVSIVDDGTVRIEINVSEHDHVWDSGYYSKEPTCGESGNLVHTCTLCGRQASETVGRYGHSYGTKEEATCTETGYVACTRCGSTVITPKTGHNWDTGVPDGNSSCDGNALVIYTCRDCGTVKTEETPDAGSHSYRTSIIQASPARDGSITKACTRCGHTVLETVIARPSYIEISADTMECTGSLQKPAVAVYDAEGSMIQSAHYSIVYSNNVRVGTATVTVKFRGSYTGTLSGDFRIVPSGTKILALAPVNGGFTVKWSMQSRETDGYEIEYASMPDFSDAETVRAAKYTTLVKSVTGLRAGEKYYVRVRTYKGSSYSEWSGVKTVTISG